MIKINERLMGIDLDEMTRLTRQTRQILLRSYLRRHIPVPFWVVKPERDETAQNGARIARSFDGQNVYVAENSNLQRESTTSKALPSHFQSTSNDAEIDDLEVGGSGSGSGPEVGREVDSARAQRVITAFLDGDSYTKIAKDIYGVAGGRKYNDARDEIDLILRSHILTLKKGN